jgi:hypothetical protein
LPLPQQSALLRCVYLFTTVMTRVWFEAVRHWAVAGHDIPSLCACSGLVCVCVATDCTGSCVGNALSAAWSSKRRNKLVSVGAQ